MADASLLQHSFLGGEWSKFFQGRSDRPDYRTGLNVCLNYIPIETGALVRRPGFGFAGTTRGGAIGRLNKFDFQQQAPYVMEFTDAHLRFWSGTTPVSNNDSQAVSAISTANPAVVTTITSPPTGATIMFSGLAASCPLLQNRQFLWTHISGTTGSIADAITGVTIDGSTLGVGSLAATAQIFSIAEVATPYTGRRWQDLRVVQAEQTAFLLENHTPPQQLIANPAAGTFAGFSLAPSFFEDGPYLDPITGSILTASAVTGIVTLTASLQAWVSTAAYTIGEYVLFASKGYISLQDANVGNTPGGGPILTLGTITPGTGGTAGTYTGVALTGGSGSGAIATIVVASGGVTTVTVTTPGNNYAVGDVLSAAPATIGSTTGFSVPVATVTPNTAWKLVGVGAPINNGQGFLSSDIGRLVRLYSEPPVWVATTTYSAGSVVSYNPSGLPGQSTYWQSINGGNIGNVPGTDIKNWQLLAPGGQIAFSGVTQTATAGQLTVNPSTPVIWSWGKILAISNVGAISGTLAGSTNIGNLTSGIGGGLAAAFDGNTVKGKSACALGVFNVGGSPGGFVGKNYTGASPQTIAQAVIYPENQYGIEWHFDNANGDIRDSRIVTVNLWASNVAPSNANNGTLLGTATIAANSLAPVTILSNNTVTTWNYVWVEAVTLAPFTTGPFAGQTDTGIAQVIFYSASAAPGTAASCEILGPPLLYSGVPINTWRLGVYSGTTGYPTNGTYSDGRLWLSGAVANRFDASVANGVNGIGNGSTLGSVNFAPTDQYGNVLASSGISYVLNAPDVNPIFWMQPDLQGIILGTKAGEWLVSAPTSGGFSPLNIAARRVTQIGAANIEPRRTEHTTVFVQKFTRKIMEYFADVFSGKFTAPHITEKSKHLTIGNIAEIAYQQELAPVAWARVAGGLVGWSYKRDTLMTSQGPTFAAGHRHALGSGRTIESIAVGPSVGGNLDALSIITNDPATMIRHVMVMTDIVDEGSTLAMASYVDDAVTPTSTSTSNTMPSPYGGLTLNGLWHLNGKTVTAWLGGLDCGDYTVANGSITVPYGDGIPFGQGAGTANGLFTATFVTSGVTANGVTMFTGTMPMRVGFTYTSQAQIIRPMAPAESGARSGPAFGKMRRAHQYAAQLEGTGVGSVSFGEDFSGTLLPALFRQLNNADYTIDTQFNGLYWNTVVQQYSRDGAMLSLQVTRPYIVNVVAVGEYLETQD